VLYHEPCYCFLQPQYCFGARQTDCGGDLLPKDAFGIDPEAVANAWEPGCKVLMLNFPTNPNGGCDRAC
jgi:aminotransferase